MHSGRIVKLLSDWYNSSKHVLKKKKKKTHTRYNVQPEDILPSNILLSLHFLHLFSVLAIATLPIPKRELKSVCGIKTMLLDM